MLKLSQIGTSTLLLLSQNIIIVFILKGIEKALKLHVRKFEEFYSKSESMLQGHNFL